MLKGKKLDRKLHGYVRHFSSRGYSRRAIKTALLNLGLDERYADKIIGKQKEEEFFRKYAIAASFLLLSILFFSIASSLDWRASVTGFAVSDEASGNYILLNVDYNEGYLKLNSASFVNLEDIIGANDNSGFLIRTISRNKDYKDLFYVNLENGGNLIFIPHSEGLDKIQFIENDEMKLEINAKNIT